MGAFSAQADEAARAITEIRKRNVDGANPSSVGQKNSDRRIRINQ